MRPYKMRAFPIPAITVAVVVSATVISPGQAEQPRGLPPYLQQLQARNAQRALDQETAKDPESRRVLLGHLYAAAIQDAGSKDEEAWLNAGKNVERLADVETSESTPFLVKLAGYGKYDFVAQGRPFFRSPLEDVETLYPALAGLKRIGRPAIPLIIESLSVSAENGVEERNLLHALRQILDYRNNVVTRQMLRQYASEYDFKTQRLRYVSDQWEKFKAPANFTAASNMVVDEPADSEHSIGYWILEASYESDKTKAVRALVYLAQNPSPDANSILAQHLDVTDEQGRSIAAMSLLKIGKMALPSVADAIADRGRSPQFVNLGVQIIKDVTGDPAAARQVLVAAVESNERKVARLKAIASSLPVF